jgi:hypothetical protein
MLRSLGRSGGGVRGGEGDGEVCRFSADNRENRGAGQGSAAVPEGPLRQPGRAVAPVEKPQGIDGRIIAARRSRRARAQGDRAGAQLRSPIFFRSIRSKSMAAPRPGPVGAGAWAKPSGSTALSSARHRASVGAKPAAACPPCRAMRDAAIGDRPQERRGRTPGAGAALVAARGSGNRRGARLIL